MEKGKTKSKQSTIELLILLIFCFYDVGMFLMSIVNQWETGYSIGIALTGILSVIMYIGQYADYRVRVFITTILMQGALLMYAQKMRNMSNVMPIFNLMLIMIALYEVKEAVYITILTFFMIMYINRLVSAGVNDRSIQNLIVTIMQSSSLVVVELLVSNWVEQTKRNKQQLLETIEELKEAERSKDDFLANVSHEIRTPINSICGMSEIVLHEQDMSKIKEDIYTIQNSGENLASIVSDILDFSELQSDKLEIVEEPYNITSTINDIIHTVMAKKADKNIEVVVDCDANIPCLLVGDEKKLKRVIMNILDNAIKFTQEGCISITISSRKESYGVNLLVSIRDTGIGMRQESLEKMFNSFNQVDTRRNRMNGGIGIGIAISQAIIRKMGGFISVKSALGKGSTFKIVVPQKVKDDRPIIGLEEPQKINAAIYVDMEQFNMTTVRDEYTKNIMHMAEQLHVRCQMCRKLAELKRRVEREEFSHIFISLVEYREDQNYFHQLALKTRVIIVIDRSDEKYVLNENIIKMYKPFYVLPIVAILHGGQAVEYGRTKSKYERFVAPEVQVLVVDDNITNLRVVEGLLERYQIKVTTATSGKDTLSMIEKKKFDIIFMDHMMPEMDGVETLHHIREKVGIYYQRVPVIALTANAVTGMRSAFLAEGFADFVEKPIEISELERALKRNIPEEKMVYLEPDTGWNLLPEAGTESEESDLKIGDIDIEKGIMYCGSLEKYQEITRLHYTEAALNRKQIVKYFEEQNWKDYTITVHGLKSSMLSVGAITLSEIAKGLELAGKENRIDYILEHQKELLEEYDRVVKLFGECKWIQQKEEENVVVEVSAPEEASELKEELENITQELFMELAGAFEDAMYAFDEQQMLRILEDLKKYSYEGKALKKEIASIIEKVKASDYMSASEELWTIQREYKREEEGHVK